MAKPLSNEIEIYQSIKDEKITIPSFIWDAIYNFLGDYISVINFLATYYIEQNKPIDVAEAKKITQQTVKIMEVIRKCIYPHKITDAKGRFVQIKEESVQLPAIVRECFTHYIGNDTQIINMCVYSHIDSISEESIPVEEAKVILLAAQSMGQFLNRLQQATLVANVL